MVSWSGVPAFIVAEPSDIAGFITDTPSRAKPRVSVSAELDDVETDVLAGV
jgi:hypothetical protein